MSPAQQIELAGTPIEAVEQAIADGQARTGNRDLAGWVVYLLRQRRDTGWVPAPPTPRSDAPEALGEYFKQLAAEREQAVIEPAPLPALVSAPPPAVLWEDVLGQLRLRLPRAVSQAAVWQTELVSVTGDVAMIAVADMHLKDALEHQHASALRLALNDVIGQKVVIRVVRASQ